MGVPCSSSVYRIFASTCSASNRCRVLPWRVHRRRPGSSYPARDRSRDARALRSLISRPGSRSALTTTCTWLVRTCTAPQSPPLLAAERDDRITHRLPLAGLHRKGGLTHRSPRLALPARIGREERGPVLVVNAINRARLLVRPVQPGPIRAEGDEVRNRHVVLRGAVDRRSLDPRSRARSTRSVRGQYAVSNLASRRGFLIRADRAWGD